MIAYAGPVLPVLSAAVLAVALTACAAGAEPAPDAVGAPPALPAESTAPVASPSAAAPTSTPAPTPTARVIELSYAGGTVSGDTGRQTVELGEQVVLRVTSDVAEEVHVHGYDVTQAVPAGSTVDIALTASIPGGFEVELHEAGTALCQLRVA